MYDSLDWLLSRQAAIEKKLAKRHLQQGSLVLYDLTSTWVEGRSCPLAKLGYSRDGKKNKLQIVFGLLCERDGRPVGVEVFEGNTGDPATLGSQIRKVRERFELDSIVFVGDRGMITEARIREELRPEEGLEWISSLRAPQIQRLAKDGMLQPSLFDELDLAEIHHPSFPGERLIACRNPLLATERARKREEMLVSTESKLEVISKATKRDQRPLRGKDTIGIRLGRVFARSKMGKHFRYTITDDGFDFERDNENIEREAALDGIYIIRTSLTEEAISADEAVRTYKGLAVVERAFRCCKTVDLKVRPIYHYNAERVRAHIFLCMLAYYVEWHMRKALVPILFDDDDPDGAHAKRSSIVSPATPSDSAQAKASTKKTPDGLPVHSFRTLLSDLATVTKNQVENEARGLSFVSITRPTPLQHKAFNLLEINPRTCKQYTHLSSKTKPMMPTLTLVHPWKVRLGWRQRRTPNFAHISLPREVFDDGSRLHPLWAPWRQLLPSFPNRAHTLPPIAPAILASRRSTSSSITITKPSRACGKSASSAPTVSGEGSQMPPSPSISIVAFSNQVSPESSENDRKFHAAWSKRGGPRVFG